MVLINDPEHVRAQYADESRLLTRMSVWRGTDEGKHPQDLALAAIQAARPRRVLEVGCGSGVFAHRVPQALPEVQLVATDQSASMVDLARARGLHAQQADIASLPFADGSFDVVAALWMLYHVPDLHAGLDEVRRVLRPGGLFVCVTNGDQHLAGLMHMAGAGPVVTTFSTETGHAVLKRHFDDVSQENLVTWAHFPDHAAAQAYLRTVDDRLGAPLPPFEGERRWSGSTTVFTAR